MDNKELAEQIRKRYIPFAFTCDCAGNHEECADVMKDRGAWVQQDTALRIARFIESLEK
jgi:hypothetical protein